LSGGQPCTVGQPNGTWEWDGVRWSQVSTNVGWSNISWSATHRRVVGFDGATGDTWTWNGTVWNRIPGPIAGRSSFAISYDVGRRRVVAYEFGTVSEWDGATWRSVAGSGPQADLSAMVYDAARGNTLLFGGEIFGFGPLGETWTWSGVSWNQLRPPVAPPPRLGHAMAYDSQRSRVVLFGGDFLDDTWEWDGTNWIERVPAQRPGSRSGHRMAYDSSRGRVVLYGGYGGLEDTWEWDGTNWVELRPAQTPGPRLSFGMSYDPIARVVVLTGGNAAGDTWQWDGANWTPIATAGRAPWSGNMVWDDARQEMVALTRGSNAETWVLRNTVPASTQTYGTGCASSVAPSSLANFGRPALGNRSFAIDLYGVASFAPAAVVVSTSPSAVAVGPCTILVGPGPSGALLTHTNARGFASARLPIPASTSVLGAQVFAQGWVLDPSSPIGVALTPGVALVLGE